MPREKEKPPRRGKVIHQRADGTIVESMKGVEIPPDNGYYDVVARIAERLMNEGIPEEVENDERLS